MTPSAGELLLRVQRHFWSQLPDTCTTLSALARRLGENADDVAAHHQLEQHLHRLHGTTGTIGLGGISEAALLLRQQMLAWRTHTTLPASREQEVRCFIRQLEGWSITVPAEIPSRDVPES